MNQSETTARTCVVLTSAREAFDVRDVIHAALFRGELQEPWEELLALMEAERLGGESGKSPDDAVLQEMSEQFRTERDLISAEEAETWLQQRGLSLDDFSGYFIRRYWRSVAGAKLEQQEIDYSTASCVLRDLLRVELWFTGSMDKFATQLAWRIAAMAAAGDVRPDSAQVARERQEFYVRAGLDDSTLPGWFSALGRDELWLCEMLELEALFCSQVASLITPETLERNLGSLRLPLTRFEVEFIEVESLDAAREASLCIRLDNLPMEDVAKKAGYPYRKTTIAFEDLGSAMQPVFLRGVSGEVLEPFDLGEGFQLCRLIQKLEPNLGNAKARQRAEERIVERYFNELASRHVRWEITPAVSA